MKMTIKPSTKPNKKLMAVFTKDNGRTKTTHFGAKGMDDYTITKDKEQRARYIKRHTNSRENHSNYMSAGALSRHILWGASTSRSANISAYKRRFGLS